MRAAIYARVSTSNGSQTCENAVALRHHDPDFAETLDMKAHYWCDRTQWSDADIRRAGIPLKDIRARARSLLRGEI